MLVVAPLVICALIFITGFLKNSDIFSPWRLYVMIHSLTLGIAQLNLLPAMTPLKPLTWLVVLSGHLAFVLGYCSFKLVFIPPSKIKDDKSPLFRVNRKLLWMLYGFGVFLYVLVYLYHYYKVGYIPLFSPDSSEYRFRFMTLNYFTSQVLFIFPLFYIASYSIRHLAETTRIVRSILYFIEIILIFSYLVLLNRNSIALLIIFYLITRNYCVKKISLKVVAIIGIISIAIFFAIGSLRLKQDSNDLLHSKEVQKTLVSYLYSYPANNFWNIDYALNPFPNQYKHPYTFGFEYMSPFIEFTPFLSKIRDYFGFEDLFIKKIMKVRGLNSMLYIWHFYKEFTPFLMSVVIFISSFFIAWVYHLMILGKNIFLVWLYAIITFGVLFSFMIPAWYLTFFWVIICITCVLYFYNGTAKLGN